MLHKASAFTSPRCNARTHPPTSGLNQVHGCLAREPSMTPAQETALNPRSLTILTLNSRWLTAHLGHTPAQDGKKSDIPCLFAMNHTSSHACASFPGACYSYLAELSPEPTAATATPPPSTELTVRPEWKLLKAITAIDDFP